MNTVTDHAAVVRKFLTWVPYPYTDEATAAVAALEQELAEAKRERDDARYDAKAFERNFLDSETRGHDEKARAEAAEARVKELDFSLGLSEKAQKVFRDRAVAAESALAEAKQRIAYLTAEAHGWQPRLAQAEAERDEAVNLLS